MAAIAEATEAAGGKVESMYFAFGDNDVYIIVDYPDNVTAAGAALVRLDLVKAATKRPWVIAYCQQLDRSVTAP